MSDTATANGAPANQEGEIYVEYWRLGEILEAKVNPKEHDDEGIDESMDRWGYTAPPLIDERTERLVAGHGRLRRLHAKKLDGQTPPKRILLDDDGEWRVPILRGIAFNSDKEAQAYVVADNMLTQAGGWNEEELADWAASAKDEDGGLDGTGFSRAQAEALVAKHALPDDFPEYGEDAADGYEGEEDEDDEDSGDYGDPDGEGVPDALKITCPNCDHVFIPE